MSYLLDTNTCIRYLNGRSENLRRHLESIPARDLALCSIGPNDLLIASIALTHRATLVTNNTREFSRVPELQLEDWE